MAELNQFAISRALDSTMTAGETPRFGRLGLLPLVARACRPAAPAITPDDTEIVTRQTNSLQMRVQHQTTAAIRVAPINENTGGLDL